MKIFTSAALGLFLAALLPATPIKYSVMVNTASLSGSQGSLDFNFNPGPFATQTAMLAIQSFGGDGTPEGSPQTIGDVSGHFLRRLALTTEQRSMIIFRASPTVRLFPSP